jgi:hypothetical protein
MRDREYAHYAINTIVEETHKFFHEQVEPLIQGYYDRGPNPERDVEWLHIRGQSEIEGVRILNLFLGNRGHKYPLRFQEQMQRHTLDELVHHRILFSTADAIAHEHGVTQEPARKRLSETLYCATIEDPLELFAGALLMAEGLANHVNDIVIARAQAPIADAYRRIRTDELRHVVNGARGVTLSVNNGHDAERAIAYARAWMESERKVWPVCYGEPAAVPR